MLYRDGPISLVANAGIGSLTALGLWDSLPRWQSTLWLAIVFAVSAARLALWLAFRRTPTEAADPSTWGRRWALGSGAAGLTWGLGSFLLFVPEALHYQLLLVFVLSCMATSAIFALATSVPALVMFQAAMLIPTALSLAIRGDAIHNVLAAMTVFYLGVTVTFGRRFNLTVIESLQLRFANIGLVEELTLQKEEAERANAAKSRFLAAASHDLRQPVHALNLFVQSLRESTLPPAQRQLVGNISASVEAMGGLFDALLDISKLDAQVIRPDMRDFRIDYLLAILEPEYSSQARAKRLQLKMRGVRGAVVRSDPALLERILRNLLANAVNHTATGKILVGCRKRGALLRIEVWDTGPGIPESQREEIFQEFVQLGNPERDRRKGLGLGLAIVARLARLLDIRVGLRSEVSRGSMFSVEVPLGDSAVPGAATMPESLPPATAGNALIVVVDDESAILEGMRTLLTGWGHEVIAASSRTQALHALAQAARVPGLIISDYRLREEENGLQVIEALREEFNAEIPAVLITGDTAPERLRDAQSSGFPLLHKPVQVPRLRGTIATLLREHTGREPGSVAR